MPVNSAKSEDVQKIILALLVSQKDAVPLGLLDRDYKEQEGECIPWKEFGYISLFDYLKSMPKYFHLERINGIYYVRGIASDKSKHVSLLVSKQKNIPKKFSYIRKTYKPSHYYPKTQRPRIHLPTDILSNIIDIVRANPNGISKDYLLKKVKEKLPYVNISIMDLEEKLKDISHKLFVQGNLVLPNQSKTNFISEQCASSKISTKVDESIQSQNVTTTPKYCISGDSDSELNINDDDDDDFSFVSNNIISSDSNENNKNTTSRKKQPISMFIQETLSKCHVQGDKINGTLKHSVTENEHYDSQENRTLDILAERECQDDSDDHINDDTDKSIIDERTRFRLEKLIQKHPNGIWCAELPEIYLQEYDRPLNYIELGFNSVREFASCLPEIFQYRQLQPLEDFILYDAKRELTDTKKRDKTNSERITEFAQFYQEQDEIEAVPPIVSIDTSKKLTPEGVMVIGETVGQISVIDLENRVQPYIEVFVEEVFTPSLFWVQLRKKKKLFNKLMEDLHIFYEEKSELYKIPLVVIEKGLNCACIYNNQWHRGIIKQVRPDLQVTVMFYDYGTLKTYSPEAIYYLHRSFSYLPAQAIPCGLYNTKPCVGEQWSRGVTHEFAFRTAQRPLIATIVSTDPQNNSMLVTLTDTMEEEDVHINDWLVQQNLALHGKMVRIRPRNFPYHYYLECKKHYRKNCINCQNSKSNITKSYKKCILSQYLTNNSTPHDLCESSNHVLSASVSNDSHDNLFSNIFEKDTQISQILKANSIENNNLIKSTGLVQFFEKIMNKKKSSSSSYEAKSDSTQLHSDTNMIHSNKNESKTKLEKKDNSNCTSSSIKSNDSIPISQDDCFVKNQLLSQNNCITNTNCKDHVEKQDVHISTQQNEYKQKDIPLPKKCFTNAVNLSVDSKSYCPYYDTLPDDNITICNDTSQLNMKRKHKINLKNIEIGISEMNLSALRSSRNHVTNEYYLSTLKNEMNSSNKVQNVTTDFQQNGSSDNRTITPNIQKLFNVTDINENENDKCNDESTKSYNTSKEECILSNTIEHHELIINNTIDFNSNLVTIYDDCSANLKNKIQRFETFNNLLQIYNKFNNNSKLDSDDSSDLDSDNINTYEIDRKIFSNTSDTSADITNEKRSNLIYRKNINENNLVTVTCDSQLSLDNEDNKTKELIKLDVTMYMDADEEVVPTYNDNDIDSDQNEWDVVGDMHDFFPTHFLSNVEMNHMVKNDDEECLKITEINDHEFNEKRNE